MPVRSLSKHLAVSVTTVLEAYRVLEDRRRLEVRPQSGHYVAPPVDPPPTPEKTESCRRASELEISELIVRIRKQADRTDLVPLGAGVPSPSFYPVAQLSRLLARVVREESERCHRYDELPGNPELRVQVAQRLLGAGCTLGPDDVITTNGAQEALYLCLKATTEPGDVVAIESPTFFGILEVIESLHLRAFEVATDPEEGMCLTDLEDALENRGIAAVVMVPTFGNPLGHTMPEAKRQALVELLERHDVPLVEDDVYGELYYDERRARAVKAFDRSGLVLLCSSFSKTLAPGYRVGWPVPGRYRRRVEALKFSSSVATPVVTQLAVARYLAGGGFDRMLRGLRAAYRENVQRICCAVGDGFPRGTRVTRPRGGHLLWVEMPSEIDSIRLHEQALELGISVAPGPIFSATKRYRNCLRLNGAVEWGERLEQSIATLGRLAQRLLNEAHRAA